MARVDDMIDREVDRVLALLTPDNRLAVRVCLQTGLRIGDVLALRRSDLAKGPQFWITEAKTGKRRRVQLPHALHAELLATCGDVWAFPSRYGDDHGHRTRQAVWRDLKRAQKALRLKINVGTHSARKTYAVRLMAKYHDVAKVQRALGHDRPTTTMIYAMADGLSESRRKKAPPVG